jgi:hypothetical protein
MTPRQESLTGWRWETVDRRKRHGLLTRPHVDDIEFGAYEYSHYLGGAMASLPDGGWSPPAVCTVRGPYPHPRPRRREKPPVAGCHCGYRVCSDIHVAHDYYWTESHLHPFGLVLVQVETRGKVVANDNERNLGADNCLSARQIRPIWPAFVTDKRVAEMMTDHYPGADVQVVDDFRSAERRWAEIDSGRYQFAW